MEKETVVPEEIKFYEVIPNNDYKYDDYQIRTWDHKLILLRPSDKLKQALEEVDIKNKVIKRYVQQFQEADIAG